MKCEICHKNEAVTAIPTIVNGVDDELYVCSDCARNEKLRSQKKSQRTRKETLLPPGVSMSVTQIGLPVNMGGGGDAHQGGFGFSTYQAAGFFKIANDLKLQIAHIPLAVPVGIG